MKNALIMLAVILGQTNYALAETGNGHQYMRQVQQFIQQQFQSDILKSPVEFEDPDGCKVTLSGVRSYGSERGEINVVVEAAGQTKTFNYFTFDGSLGNPEFNYAAGKMQVNGARVGYSNYDGTEYDMLHKKLIVEGKSVTIVDEDETRLACDLSV